MVWNAIRTNSRMVGMQARGMLDRRKEIILNETKSVRSKMVPEMSLRLITKDMAVWNMPVDESGSKLESNAIFSEYEGPYWAIFWPGGQSLARFILDFPEVVRSKRILDLGCGCGANAIASIMSGCSFCEANDIDPNSLAATEINIGANNINSNKIELSDRDYLEDIGGSITNVLEKFDVILVGDMFFDKDIGDRISRLCLEFKESRENKDVYIGDPGRWYLKEASCEVSNNLILVSKHELDEDVKEQNFGFSQGLVYKLVDSKRLS